MVYRYLPGPTCVHRSSSFSGHIAPPPEKAGPPRLRRRHLASRRGIWVGEGGRTGRRGISGLCSPLAATSSAGEAETCPFAFVGDVALDDVHQLLGKGRVGVGVLLDSSADRHQALFILSRECIELGLKLG